MKNLAIILTLIFCTAATIPSLAEEPAEQFLEALRENGYYDIALGYLDSLEKSDLVSDDFRKILPFEKAETMVSSTLVMRDLNMIETYLNDAQKILDDFVDQKQSLEMLARTLRYQGNLYYRRSKLYSLRADSDRLTAAEKAELENQSREMLKKSLTSYQEARKTVRSLIDPASPDGLKIDPQDPSTTARLKQFQNVYTQIRIRLPMVIEQIADTYPENNPERVKNLEAAVKEYNSVYDSYFKYAAGLDARVFAARASQKLGKHKEALILLEDIFNFSESSTLRKLKQKAFMIGCDSWNKLEEYPVDEVIARLEPVVEVLNRAEVREPDWLRIQLELAIAKHKKATAVKAAGGPKANSDSDSIDRAAAKILRSVARAPSEHRDRAKQLLSEWDVKISDVADAASTAPESFADAKQKAKDYVLEIESLISETNQLRGKLAAANEAQKPDIQSELADVEERIDEQANHALSLLGAALQMTDEATLRADINNVRYLQCFCYFAMQQYFESALIGEFLLDKYPNVESTRPAMTLMIQSYTQLLAAADEADRDYELNRLTNACTAVVERWPGSNESGAAANTLVRLAMMDKDFGAAEKYFAQIPTDASYRANLAAQLGTRLWFDYRSKLPATPETAEAMKQELLQTKTYLQSGVRETPIDDLNYDVALGSLFLVDAYLESGEVDEAVKQLETAAIAPLDLVKQKHPAVAGASQAEQFNRETYKVAIKTYLAAMRNSENPQQWIDKASGVIAAMRVEMESSQDPQARQRVTQIYGLIATELLEQFGQLESADEKKKFAASLASFLGSIEKESKDSRIILWAGSTLLNVAESLSGMGLTTEAKPLFTQAVSALSRAEELGFPGDPQETAMRSELQRQRALAQRGSGDFQGAVNQFVSILEKKASNLNVQIDAAETLQAWGKESKRSKLYAEAMMGSQPTEDPKTKRKSNLIWGWSKMSKATRSNEKFKDAFYRSLYNLAECRLEYGILESNAKAIKSALTEIENAEKRDPQLGGPAWATKFSELKARVKQNLK